MKKIGLVGGISWSSTMDYYRLINEGINKRLGGLNYAECLIYSVNFNHFQRANAAHDWSSALALLSRAAVNLEKAGADMVLLCANTAHIVADGVSDRITIPLIDIRTATIKSIQAKGLQKIGLLGTSYTMELDFYKSRLQESGIEVIVPAAAADRAFIEHTLLYELGRGIIVEETKRIYLKIIESLISQGAEGIVLGCTEIPLLIKSEDVSVPTFNTTQLHAEAAVEIAIK